MSEKHFLDVIKRKCLECCGYEESERRLCECKECELYPYRLGKKPDSMKKKVSEVHLEALKQRLSQTRTK